MREKGGAHERKGERGGAHEEEEGRWAGFIREKGGTHEGEGGRWAESKKWERDGQGPRSERERGEAHWSRRERVMCVNIVAHLNSREVIDLKNQL